MAKASPDGSGPLSRNPMKPLQPTALKTALIKLNVGADLGSVGKDHVFVMNASFAWHKHGWKYTKGLLHCYIYKC